ncbi:hypothetical protein [uncultured Brachyspira sp.]|uniref:hypothetical protein n=1 Tax=uncultured Brachyspira sp. TaxID=221953 RepID=UPI0025CC550B|nr:hypothetical protein [uncultured Brachyspira sp.]
MKKLFILLVLCQLMLLSCNIFTKPGFLISNLIGEWVNKNNSQDRFFITKNGDLIIDDGIGNSHNFIIQNWDPYEKVVEYKLNASSSLYTLTFRFTSPNYCECTLSSLPNYIEVFIKR